MDATILLGVIFGLAVGFPAGHFWALRPRKRAPEERSTDEQQRAALAAYKAMKNARGS
jgi:hypothetical protein